MSSSKQTMFHRLTDADLRDEMERRYAESREAILAEIKERLAMGTLTIKDLVTLTIERSYWRGALDATEPTVSIPVEDEKPAQEAS